MIKEINGFINKIYENFFMRDLTYIFGGSILLASIYHALEKEYALEQKLSFAIKYVTQNFFAFLILMAVTYFIGLIAQEGCLNLFEGCWFLLKKLFGIKPSPKRYDSIDEFKALLSQKFGANGTRELERTIFLKNMGSAVGASSGISAIIFLVLYKATHEPRDLRIFFVLAIITSVCIWEYIVKRIREYKSYREFAKHV